MMIDPILVGLGILVAIVVYQQFVIRNMWYDIDDIITDVDSVIAGHNKLVMTLSSNLSDTDK